MRPQIVWGSTLGALIAYDIRCAYNDTDGDSLSEVVRAALRTDTKVGRALFVGGWLALSGWLLPHILRGTDIDLGRLTVD